jgi:peptide-methionine (S)-S-oxide reductase
MAGMAGALPPLTCTCPTTCRQGNDRGTQYRSGIFYHDEAQRAAAEARVKLVDEQIAQGKGGRNWAGSRVVADMQPCGPYYLAEAYHQQYLARGGRAGDAQSAAKGCTDPIRCYG